MSRDLIFSIDHVDSYGIKYDYSLPFIEISKNDFKHIKKVTKRCLKELKKAIRKEEDHEKEN